MDAVDKDDGPPNLATEDGPRYMTRNQKQIQAYRHATDLTCVVPQTTGEQKISI
jgi:hypothetical protein